MASDYLLLSSGDYSLVRACCNYLRGIFLCKYGYWMYWNFAPWEDFDWRRVYPPRTTPPPPICWISKELFFKMLILKRQDKEPTGLQILHYSFCLQLLAILILFWFLVLFDLIIFIFLWILLIHIPLLYSFVNGVLNLKSLLARSRIYSYSPHFIFSYIHRRRQSPQFKKANVLCQNLQPIQNS